MKEHHAWLAGIMTLCVAILSIATYHIGRDARLDAMNVCIGMNPDQATRIRCTEIAWGGTTEAQ